MKLGISTWSFPATMDLGEKLRLTREAGFHGFELDLSDNGPITVETTSTELAKVKDLLTAHDLAAAGLATGLYWGTNPASNDPEVRRRASRILERQIEIASELEIDTILVVPGVVQSDFQVKEGNIAYSDAFERAREFIESGLDRAGALGVTIGVENVWNQFLLSPLEMAGFIDGFAGHQVGAYFDVGNALAFGNPEDWIAHLGPRIKRIHFKDYRRKVGTIDGFVDLLSGDVNWPRVMESLRTIGYQGWCTAEMIPPVPFYRFAPEVLIENTARAMRAIVALPSP